MNYYNIVLIDILEADIMSKDMFVIAIIKPIISGLQESYSYYVC